jgi:hypothetical protein
VPRQLEVILSALLVVSVFFAIHYAVRKIAGTFSSRIVRPIIRHVFRPILTLYYRRKVAKQIQADRKAKGLPPLENQNIL